MRSSRTIHVVSAHAGGEVGDVIVGGVVPPPGDTLWAQRDFIARDGTLRDFVLNEPRGGVFRHVNLLVPPKDPAADMGFIVMEPADTPPMSGSNTICVATVLLETGHPARWRSPKRGSFSKPRAVWSEVVADCRNGAVEAVTLTNLPSFAHRLAVPLEVPGFGTVTVDTGFGGDSFVIVDAEETGLGIEAAPRASLPTSGPGSPLRPTRRSVSNTRFFPTGPTIHSASSRGRWFARRAD